MTDEQIKKEIRRLSRRLRNTESALSLAEAEVQLRGDEVDSLSMEIYKLKIRLDQ